MESLVIPASDPVTNRFVPIMLFTNVDFPVFGLPITLTLIGEFSLLEIDLTLLMYFFHCPNYL